MLVVPEVFSILATFFSGIKLPELLATKISSKTVNFLVSALLNLTVTSVSSSAFTGLICVAIHPIATERLKLPFMHDVLKVASEKMNELASVSSARDIKYDSRSSFSLWVNHRDTFTGITDSDRSLTIRRIGEVVDYVMMGHEFDFGSEFRSPGHVALLRAAESLTYDRVGQTELSVALAEMAGIGPAVAICEMLDSSNGKALNKEKAMQYGIKNGIPFIEGKEIDDMSDEELEDKVEFIRRIDICLNICNYIIVPARNVIFLSIHI